jgi:hypothetical protein
MEAFVMRLKVASSSITTTTRVINKSAGAVSSFATQHPGIVTATALALGVASMFTGISEIAVGAGVVDLGVSEAALGLTSIATGVAAAALDSKACSNGNSGACMPSYSGAFGSGIALVQLLAPEYAPGIEAGVNLAKLMLGTASYTLDARSASDN